MICLNCSEASLRGIYRINTLFMWLGWEKKGEWFIMFSSWYRILNLTLLRIETTENIIAILYNNQDERWNQGLIIGKKPSTLPNIKYSYI